MRICIVEIINLRKKYQEEIEVFTSYEKALDYGRAKIHGKEKDLYCRYHIKEVK